MKSLHSSCTLGLFTAATTLGLLLPLSSTHAAAVISHLSTTKISGSSDFTVSVFDGKAGFTGLASGTFGDGTVEGYSFYRNGTPNPDLTGYAATTIESYSSGGSNITVDSYNGGNNFDTARGDVWTTNDPDLAAANFGGTTETISGGYLVTGTIDISNYTSGTVYVLLGGYDTPFDLSLTPNVGTTVAMPQVDPGTDRNMYVAAFSFVDTNNDASSIEYSYTGNAQNRARFMGVVVVDATAIPEPSTALLGGLGCLFLLRRRRS